MTVHGVVRGWGRVIEHEHGWRAQYAYPAVVLTGSSVVAEWSAWGWNVAKILRDLSDAYAVPFFGDVFGFASEIERFGMREGLDEILLAEKARNIALIRTYQHVVSRIARGNPPGEQSGASGRPR